MSRYRKSKLKIDSKIGYSNQIITNPLQFYLNFKPDKAVKFKENPHPFLEDVKVIDIVIAGKGMEEDAIYEQYPYYRNNIRRGNTLLKIGKEIHWVRRGLRKFFDIRIQNLSGQLQGNRSHIATFRQIQNVLSCSNIVDEKDQPICYVWKLLKANGENCQISYSKQIDMWCICSKNVSILVRDEKDLKDYKDQRYQFALEIAECFFKILKTNNYSPGQMQEFTSYLSNKTMIGQYCGNQKHQHIVKYQEEVILFYAIVDNRSEDSCLPPSVSSESFKKFRLSAINNIDKSLIGKFKNYKDLSQSVKKLFQEVSSSTLDCDEEGAVLYFGLQITDKFYQEMKQRKLNQKFPIPNQCNPITLKISSLAKLKTLQYRILRKLRQKLRKISQSQNLKKFRESAKNIFSKFRKQSKQLINQSEMQTPFEYYELIALQSLLYIENNIKNPGALQILRTAYIDFLSIIMDCIDKGIDTTFEMMGDNNLLQSLRKRPWSQYNRNVKELHEKKMQQFYPNYKKDKKIQQIEKEASSSENDPDVQDDL